MPVEPSLPPAAAAAAIWRRCRCASVKRAEAHLRHEWHRYHQVTITTDLRRALDCERPLAHSPSRLRRKVGLHTP